MADTFTGWVQNVLEFAHDEARSAAGRDGITAYLLGQLEERRTNPGDDLISELLHTEVDGAPIDDLNILGMAALTLIAGVDTTWSSIGSSMLHLATHPDDAQRLVDRTRTDADRDRGAAARLLAGHHGPHRSRRHRARRVSRARRRQGDLELPRSQSRPGSVRPARRGDPRSRENRHVAFGLGIHRCAGSNLARMELRVGDRRVARSASPRSASPRTRRSRGQAVKCEARARSPSCSEPVRVQQPRGAQGRDLQSSDPAEVAA